MANTSTSDRDTQVTPKREILSPAQTRLNICSAHRCKLWVATDLTRITPDEPETQPEDIVSDGKTYRRLSPDYYLWLKTRYENFRKSVDLDNEDALIFDRRFESLQLVAQEHYTLANLHKAAKRLAISPMASPNGPKLKSTNTIIPFAKAKPISDCDSAFRFPADEDPALPFHETVRHSALTKIRSIEQVAVVYGWTLPELYQNRGRFRFPYGQDYGLVCFVDAPLRLAEITPNSIELVYPDGHSLFFRRRGQEHIATTQSNKHAEEKITT